MKKYFALGSYTEPILFGTGEVFQGKGKGISICSFENGEIEFLKELELRNPSFLAINEQDKKIYAVNEMKEYQGKTGGGMTQISYDENYNMVVDGSWNTVGTDPCHIEVAPNKKFVSVANFASGTVTTYSLEMDGTVNGKMQVIQHFGNSVHSVRQKGPHAHSCIFAPDTNLMYVPDLGIDRVEAYRYDDSIELDVVAEVEVDAGSGPRYGEFSKNGKDFYLINEINSQVIHFVYDNGVMRKLEIVNTLPDDFKGDNICSDLHISPNGKFLYASNRGHDSIVCYKINSGGSLTFVERKSCGGKTPRNFAIEPDGKYILVGNQDSDTITVFELDENGKMMQVNIVETGSPVCIKFFK